MSDKPEIDYSDKEPEIPGENQATRIVDKTGNEISLSSRQKNGLYARAKELRAEISDKMITHAECWSPTDDNVAKMRRREFPLNGKISEYSKIMTAIGANPREREADSYRRRSGGYKRKYF